MLSKIKGVSRLKYAVDFSSAANGRNGVYFSGAQTYGNALHSVNAFVPVTAQAEEEFVGFGGASEKFLCVVSRNKVFCFDGKQLQKACDLFGNCSGFSRAVGRDCVFISPNNAGMYRIDKNGGDRLNSLTFDGVAYVGERVAGLSMNTRIYFGAAGTDKLATNSTATRNIVLQTPCNGFASVGNNVAYALGTVCYKLTFDADNENIKAFKIAQGLEEVVPQSVAVLNDAVIFATVRGLYRLKDDKVTRIFNKSGSIGDDYSDCRACAWRGKYVLTNMSGEPLSYVLDVDSQKCCAVLPKGLTDIVDYNGETYAVFQDGTLRKMQQDKYSDLYCAIEGVDFNSMQTKYLRRVNVVTRRDLEIRISSEEEMRLYKVRGRRGMQSLTVFLKGNSFDLEIRASGQTELKKLEITADVYEEDKYGG